MIIGRRSENRVFWICLAAVYLIAFCSALLGQNSSDQYGQYLREHYLSPEDFLVECFKNHDIVFVGEHHYIKHDVELIQNVIPKLYQAGVYNLGIEFAVHGSQNDIDSLIFADTYDQKLANKIIFDFWAIWGYQEYIDIFYAAWKFNHSLPADQPKFNIYGLNSDLEWSYARTEADMENPEVMQKVFADGDSDERMAGTIKTEFIDKNKQALIYSGINHAFTKYKQPIVDNQTDSVIRFIDNRMGNRIYKLIGDRCCTVFLHSPFPSYKGYGTYVLPGDGIIDSLMIGFDPKYQSWGMDLTNSPFGEISAKTSYWSHGYPEFKLRDFCDGYIYQKSFCEYEGVRTAENFVTEENRLRVISEFANPRAKDTTRTVEWLVDMMARTANIRHRFESLCEQSKQ